MDYTKKVVMVVLFLTVVISPRGTVAQTTPTDDPGPVCKAFIEGLFVNCMTSNETTATEACCGYLKSANRKEVKCICDVIASQAKSSNVTQSTETEKEQELPAMCGVGNKFSCGISQGAMSKVAAPSMVVFVLVASLFFVMF